MFIRPRVLSILTTRRCTAACDHCCVGASPRAKDAIPIDRIHGLIDEAKRIPSIERIVFTGGECFLLGKDLDALIQHASICEFHTRVITNGYWATSSRTADDRVAELRAAGLEEMMISTGTFHQAFVPVERVVLAAKSASRAGILTRISIEECDQQRFDAEFLLAELADDIAQRLIYIGREPWIADAGGRGVTVLSHAKFAEHNASRSIGRCSQILSVITITPDEQLLSCCGYPMENLPRLRIGSIAEEPLDEVLRAAPNELVKMWLHVAGPSGIADFVARYEPEFRLPTVASICESCTALQRSSTAMEIVAAHAGEMAEQIVAAYVQLQGGIQSPDAFYS